MPKPHKTFLSLIIFGLALGLEACAAPSAAPVASTPVALSPTDTPIANPTRAANPTRVAESPTSELASTPTTQPSAAPTNTPIPPTPTVTPTPTLLGGCAEIWQPGYYKLIRDIKTTRFNCMIVQSYNVVIDCENHSIEGDQYNGYRFWIRKFKFPFLEAPSNVEIRNCKVFHHRTGVFAEAGINLYIHDNNFSDNFDDTDKRRFGIFLGLTEGGGIRLDKVQGARVENNVTHNQAIGIDVRDSERVMIRNNLAVNNSAWGISLLNTAYSEVSNNTLRDNVRWCIWGDNKTLGPGCDAAAIALQDGASHNVVKNNTITGQNANGIFIKAHGTRCGDDNLIQNNKIIDAKYNAVEFSFCRDNKVIGNEITGSYDAVWFGFSTNTEVRNNVIRDMTNHGIISFNSRGSVVTDNQIINSREGIYFYWDTWDPKRFYFLTPTLDHYASRDNLITSNILRDNSVAGIHLSNSIQNRVLNNIFANNGRDIWLEGNTEGSGVN